MLVNVATNDLFKRGKRHGLVTNKKKRDDFDVFSEINSSLPLLESYEAFRWDEGREGAEAEGEGEGEEEEEAGGMALDRWNVGASIDRTRKPSREWLPSAHP